MKAHFDMPFLLNIINTNELDGVKSNFKETEMHIVDPEKRTFFFYACAKGKLEIAEFFLALKSDINHLDENKYTPLHIAASEGHVHIIYFLLSNHALANEQNVDGQTPLHIACSKGFMKAVELLTDYNVNSKHFEKVPINGEIDLNTPDLKGATPLIRAVANEHIDVVRHLLKLNVLINEQDKDGNTALHYACYLNNEDLTTYLVLAGASIDIRNNFGYPPLAYASKGHQSNLQSLYAETCNAIKSMGKQIY